MRIELPSGTAAELARPVDGNVSRGLVLLPDIGGLRPLFDDLCQKLADDQGWAVCSPEPWPGREALTLEQRLGAVNTLTDERVLGDAVAAAEVLGVEPIGVLGFCMGGMFTLKASALDTFDRAVAFYGMIRIPEQWQTPNLGEPLAAVASGDPSKVLSIIGTADKWTPPGDVDDLEGTGATVVRYEGADHSFVHTPDRPSFRPDDATDAWRRATDFLSA